MNIYSTKNINIISLLITIIIFISINLITNNFYQKNNFEKNNLKINSEKINLEKNKNNSEKNIIEKNELNWYIEIPSINLKAPIEESIKDEVLNKAVGHFEDTGLTLGNIGLAGHNRGYENNYFENLKKLKVGDEIKYKYNNFEKIYIVKINKIIKNTNWSYLENTKENKITLITCVENKPEYRLCIQAVEKE